MTGNLHKSEAGWARFRERTQNGQAARRARMEYRPGAEKARRERAEQKLQEDLRERKARAAAPKLFKRISGTTEYVEI